MAQYMFIVYINLIVTVDYLFGHIGVATSVHHCVMCIIRQSGQQMVLLKNPSNIFLNLGLTRLVNR